MKAKIQKNQKNSIFSIGVMTGTSCDGADAAVLEFKNGKESLRTVFSKNFPSALRVRLRVAQSGKLTTPALGAVNRDYSIWMADFCAKILQRTKFPKDRVFFSIHGQTVWHQPPQNQSLGFSTQLLDASHIAFRTGCAVVSQFRQMDLALGGHGAPLAPYYHWLRAHALGLQNEFPFAIHNVGGIANLTFLTKDPAQTLAFDTGPANCLIDMAMEKLSAGKKAFDHDGKIARKFQDEIQWKKLESLISQTPYFQQAPPKSTGRELFNESFLSRLPGKREGKVANATAFTALTMAFAYRNHVSKKLSRVLICGGGAKNSFLIELFQHLMQRSHPDVRIEPLPKAFADPMYVEAMAFARLGYEALSGRCISLKNITGAKENSHGCQIFFSNAKQLQLFKRFS